MKVLIVGSGGREHALAWSLRQSPQVTEILAAPGNAGIAALAECHPVAMDDIPGLVELALREKVDLVLVGPEVPLTLGLVDRLAEKSILAFGPTQAAARLEGSKSFAKDFMKKYAIPTADYRVCRTLESALRALQEFNLPVVIKADGLAAGKGVTIALTREQAEAAIYNAMQQKIFGEAGDQVVIEEYLQGEEASILAFADGRTIVPMVASQDHKRVHDGDLGPNTGGMGAYAPAPVVTPELSRQIQTQILEPVMAGMRQEGSPYHGVLYAGLMITPHGPKVIEFNCRFGDPETQVVLPLLASDLVTVMMACIQGNLDTVPVRWQNAAAVSVVMAAPGYPGAYPKGMAISGLEEAEKLSGIRVWHAGTARKNNSVITQGGRVLNVTAIAPSIREAVNGAYEAVGKISFTGAHFRRDIACRALRRETNV